MRDISKICLSLANEMLYNVRNKSSTSKLWTKLESLYMTKSLKNWPYLIQQLYNLEIKESINVLNHLNTFNKILCELISIDVGLENEDKSLFFLNSLLLFFEYLITILLYNKNTIEFEEIILIFLLSQMKKKPNNKELKLEALFISIKLMHRTKYRKI